MKAIVYTSNTGHTAQYARMLGQKTGLPVYSLGEASKKVEKGSSVIYLGWLFANQVMGYRKAKKLFDICAVCAVGLCDTGTAIDAVRKVNAMPDHLPLFTIQGGMEKSELNGAYRFAIKMLIKAVGSKKDRTEDDDRMLYLLQNDQNYVSEENITAFMKWYTNP